MGYIPTNKSVYWLAMIAVVNVSILHAQPSSALSFTDSQLKEAGWTASQIAELRATAPPKRPMRAEIKQNETNEFSFSSVFENYQSYDDLPEIGWIEANKNVGRIGGWRAYENLVQEAQQKERESKGDDK